MKRSSRGPNKNSTNVVTRIERQSPSKAAAKSDESRGTLKFMKGAFGHRLSLSIEAGRTDFRTTLRIRQAVGIPPVIRYSAVVPSVCHAVWNGIDYPLYGFGEKVGALGIEKTEIYGPEVGVLGVVVNVIFVAAFSFLVVRPRSGRARS